MSDYTNFFLSDSMEALKAIGFQLGVRSLLRLAICPSVRDWSSGRKRSSRDQSVVASSSDRPTEAGRGSRNGLSHFFACCLGILAWGHAGPGSEKERRGREGTE